MLRTVSYCCALLVAATPVVAQQTNQRPASPSAVAAQRDLWRGVTGYITAAAEQMPEADYAFKPVATVRTFGQLIGHIAGSQNHMCGTALGENAGGEDDVEKRATTKAQLVEELKKSTALCERAYAQTDAQAMTAAMLYGRERTRLYAIGMNAVHNGEHYGNIVTYMRIKGMVPPSSQ